MSVFRVFRELLLMKADLKDSQSGSRAVDVQRWLWISSRHFRRLEARVRDQRVRFELTHRRICLLFDELSVIKYITTFQLIFLLLPFIIHPRLSIWQHPEERASAVYFHVFSHQM